MKPLGKRRIQAILRDPKASLTYAELERVNAEIDRMAGRYVDEVEDRLNELFRVLRVSHTRTRMNELNWAVIGGGDP